MTRDKQIDSKSNVKLDAKPFENPLKAFLQHSALPLTLATALLYLLGWIYSASYLTAWGLPIGIFPLTRDQSLVTGFFHLLLLFAKSMPLVLNMVILLLVGMIATMISCYKPISTRLTQRIPSVSKWLKARVSITAIHDRIIDAIGFLTGGICWTILVILFVVLLCALVEKEAKKRAEEIRTSIITGRTDNVILPARVTLSVKDENKGFANYSGHLIDNSATHAALYTERNVMLILPISQICRIEVRDRKLPAK